MFLLKSLFLKRTCIAKEPGYHDEAKEPGVTDKTRGRRIHVKHVTIPGEYDHVELTEVVK